MFPKLGVHSFFSLYFLLSYYHRSCHFFCENFDLLENLIVHLCGDILDGHLLIPLGLSCGDVIEGHPFFPLFLIE